MGLMAAKPRHFLTGVFTWTLFLFLVLNGVCYAVDSKIIFGKRKEERNVLFQAVNSAVADYKQGPLPDVVLLGSSLMMTPVWSLDLRDFPGVGDVYHHHHARTLSKLMSPASVYNFALPGAMVSDQYLLFSKLFKDDKAPKTVVYGLAPRDFMDDLLTGETRTPVFQSLSDLGDLFAYHDLYLETWQEKGDFAMNNMLFFYGKRCRYQDKFSHIVAGVYDRISPPTATAAASQNDGSLDLAAALYGDREAVWRKSKVEYGARYRRFNSAQFAKQKLFLANMLDTAAKRGIRLILVDMPLTKDNIALMPDGFYDRYHAALNEITSTHGGTVVSASQLSSFDDSCFLDTVHLNASGGAKLSSLIAAAATNKQVSLTGRSQ